LRKPAKSGAPSGEAKQVRRTAAQVNRESERREVLVKKIQELESKKKEMAAELDIQQEEEEAAEETAAVTHVSQVRQNMAAKKVVCRPIEPGPDPEDENEESEAFDMTGPDSVAEGGDAMNVDDDDENAEGQPNKVFIMISYHEQGTETRFVANEKAQARRHKGCYRGEKEGIVRGEK
jgi:hypothetical protein